MNDDLEGQIREARNHLGELMKLAKRNAPMTDGPGRISISLQRHELTELQNLARRSSTSTAALGQLAIRHLLVQARAGAIPMLPPASLDSATPITVLGRPLV